MSDQAKQIKAALLGLAVGDALGVPVEFQRRETLARNPVSTMLSGGVHQQLAGTWSDDSSMTFCLADRLTKNIDLRAIAQGFVAWVQEDYWTARGEVFDIGIATRKAIQRLIENPNADVTQAGGSSEYDNGNGSLMRMLPLVFFLQGKSIEERFEYCRQVSSITHRHIRSVIACFYYLEFARLLLQGEDKLTAYRRLQAELPPFLATLAIEKGEMKHFSRLFNDDISVLNENEIQSSGYVIHTLEASIWCLLRNKNYAATVLNAVNLGEDTDTTAAVVGGLAGLLYGIEDIPAEWLEVLAKRKEIEQLAEKLQKSLETE